MRSELEAQNDRLSLRLSELEEGAAGADYEKGYEVLTYCHKPPCARSVADQWLATLNRKDIHPKKILIRLTGKVVDLPCPSDSG